MPRQKRVDEAGVIYHAINRGNAGQAIFLKHEDYEAFLRVLSEGLEKYPVELSESAKLRLRIIGNQFLLELLQPTAKQMILSLWTVVQRLCNLQLIQQ